MEDFERSTEALEESGTSGDPAQVVDAQESQYEDAFDDFGDGQARTVDEQESSENAEEAANADEGAETAEQSARQTREENAAIRAARLQASREAKQAAERELAEEIVGAGIENPYTGKPFSSMKEFREYAAKIKEANLEKEAERTGKSVSVLREEEENRKFLTSLRKTAATGGEQKPQADFIREDLKAFLSVYPEMDAEKLEALENNQQFRSFCGSRFGREPLADLYASYLGFVQNAESAAVAKAQSRSERSTGGGSSGGATLTPTQQRSLDAWNRANPDMPMTAKEFLQLG